jgi:hypothetical protein
LAATMAKYLITFFVLSVLPAPLSPLFDGKRIYKTDKKTETS